MHKLNTRLQSTVMGKSSKLLVKFNFLVKAEVRLKNCLVKTKA